jgi:hypothetical protein
MALILKDRVKETSSSSGTGSITLGGAFPGYQTFNAAIASGSTVYYTIHNLTAGFDGEWEVGLGTFTSPATLARTTVLSSSTGSAVNFTAGASGLEVFITQPAEEAVYINQATGLVEAFGNGANTIAFTNINASNVVMVSGTISTNAANATDITNKTYVDGLFSTGITYHDPVLVESPTALIATYNQPGGAGNGVGATLTNSGSNVALSIDGVSLSNTARVLVYTQSNAAHNGVYTVTNAGAPDAPGPGAAWVLTRATDADTFGLANPNQLGQGDAFFVQSGNTGAGETYICNTVGTITFGSTNITFAQISSSQIYSAGTGLTLANLAFSISNTAVTANTYGNDGAVGQFTVNAQGQITNAATVSVNASAISVGTLANARTTASDANGASTIVARDATGSFTANTITATTSNATTFNGTTGNFTNISGNGVSLTAINASNITSGTIANARTTASDANSASTLVVRDANGAFAAGNVTAANFIGAGATITSINASNISSGTIANARTTASSSNGASTIVQRDSGGNFSANTVTAAVIGDLSGGSNINASNIASGTIANARTTASSSNGASTIVLRGASGEFAAGAITGASFSGNGSAITAINASAITTGTLDNARTTAASANGASTIVARDAGGNFSANTITATTFSGSGASLTNIPNGALVNSSTTINGTAIALGASGTITATATNSLTFGTGLSGVPPFATSYNGSTAVTITNSGVLSLANGGGITASTSTGAITLGSTANSANGASTIVARDSNGSFTANVGTFTTVSGAGGGLTDINASSISSGTVATARLGSGTANSSTFLRGDQTYAVVSSGTVIPAGTVMLFAQTTAPTGFTKNTTTGDNSALRVTTGTASTGGSVAFTTAFASQTPTGSVSTTVNNQTATNQAQTATNIATTATNQAQTATNQSITPTGSVSITAVAGSAGATTLSTPQIPSHTHPGGVSNTQGFGTGTKFEPSGSAFVPPAVATGGTGGGGSHTHPFSFSSGSGSFTGNAVTALQNSHNHTQDSHNHTQNSHNHTQDAHNHTASSSFTGNAINLAVQYIDVIRATKD